MKQVRITIRPPDAYLPPIYRRLTTDADALASVHIVNWNVADPPAAFLLRVRGAYDRLRRALADDENVRDFELFPQTGEEAYCFLAAADPTAARPLFENFTRDDVMTVPPVACHGDGSSTFTLVGTDGAIQEAVDRVPAGVDVTVDAVGTGPVAPDSVLDRLSQRQRDAVRAALAAGYYDIPREAGTEAVARELDCATATASEHLRKAERTVFQALLADA